MRRSRRRCSTLSTPLTSWPSHFKLAAVLLELGEGAARARYIKTGELIAGVPEVQNDVTNIATEDGTDFFTTPGLHLRMNVGTDVRSGRLLHVESASMTYVIRGGLGPAA